MKKTAILSVILTLSIFLATNCFADFNSAIIAYKNKNYSIAFTEFRSLAELGEVRSQSNLAVMYFYGFGVDKNINLAYAWARLSSENDNTEIHYTNILNTIKKSLSIEEPAIGEYKKLAGQFAYEVLINNTFPILLKQSKEEDTTSAVPIAIVEPRYPRDAAMNGQTGYVTVQFDLDRKGKTRNIRIIRSVPENIFNKATLRAISKWVFSPLTNKQGKPVWANDLRYTLEYKLKGYESFNLKLYNKIKRNAYSGDAVSEYSFALIHQLLHSKKMEKDVNPTEWFLKSAQQGFPAAQYQLGSSLVYGQGCYVDKSKGIRWLTRAASNGVDEASELLAKLAIQNPTLDSQKKAMKFFSDAEKISPEATIQFAWLLATSPFMELREPKKALSLLNNLPWKKYRDKVTKQEIMAAAYASMGNFKKAVNIQEDALDDAEDDELDLTDIQQHLALYKQKKTWF